MTKNQYLTAIGKLGLNQLAAGRMLGISNRQAQRLASGESPIPETVARLLWLMEYLNLTEDDLIKAIERRGFTWIGQ